MEFRKQKDIENIMSWQPPEVRRNNVTLPPCQAVTLLCVLGASQMPRELSWCSEWVFIGSQGKVAEGEMDKFK